MQKDSKKCFLCPRKCGVDRAEKTGYCGAGKKPEVALYMLHHYEEPFISGEPEDKRGSGTVFFKHCGLKCVYCQNYKISGVIKESAAAAKKENAGKNLPDIFLELQRQGATLRAVDVYIVKLRDKFSRCDDFKIVTVHGLGYKAVTK